VGLAGIEPATSALSVLRSNRLSYSPSQAKSPFKKYYFPEVPSGPAGSVRSICDTALGVRPDRLCRRSIRHRVGVGIDLKRKLRRLVTHPVHQGPQIYSAGSGLRCVESPEVMGSWKRLDAVKAGVGQGTKPYSPPTSCCTSQVRRSNRRIAVVPGQQCAPKSCEPWSYRQYPWSRLTAPSPAQDRGTPSGPMSGHARSCPEHRQIDVPDPWPIDVSQTAAGFFERPDGVLW
jgi:hypothetical protein